MNTEKLFEGCLLLCVALMIVVVLVASVGLWYIFTHGPEIAEANVHYRMTQVATCAETEQLTREECVVLIGGQQ